MMEHKTWMQWAIELQSLAQAGLAYGKDSYDKERYIRIREISAEIISHMSDIPTDKVRNLFCNESGYQTPKIDTRAAIFQNGKILLVHENNGTWSLPGGWCDVDQSVASNVRNYVYGVIKIFVLCKSTGGSFAENIETTGIGYFNRDELPANLATEKTTAEQIQMCFDANYDNNWKTQFD